MKVEGLFTAIDCKVGTADTHLVFLPTAQLPCSFAQSNEIFVQTYKAGPWHSNPNCGWTATYYSHAIVSCATWAPGESLPAPLSFTSWDNIQFSGSH